MSREAMTCQQVTPADQGSNPCSPTFSFCGVLCGVSRKQTGTHLNDTPRPRCMVRIDDAVRQAGTHAFSLEVLPPEQFSELPAYLEKIDRMVARGPAFITVTYHQAQVRIIRENGIRRVEEKQDRVGSDRTAIALQWRYTSVPAVPHLICGGFTKEETERALVQLPPYGVENVMCLRGDPNHGRVFIPHPQGHAHADGLVAQVRAMARGSYIKERDIEPFAFCIGVAGYPEGHYESPNLRADLEWTAAKITAGADFVITQLCFDTDAIVCYRNLLCRELARRGMPEVPVIPGLKVVTRARQLHGENGLPARFLIRAPDDLVERMNATDERGQREIGLQWMVAQEERLYAEGFKVVHLYTLNRPGDVLPALDALGFHAP